MNITDVRIRKVNDEGKMKAVVSITFDDEFVVHDIKVIEGTEGYFIAMPSRKTADGEYKDIPGLCKIASLSEIEEKNWSLTPGAYVGVAAAEDDGVDFAERMHEIHAELLTLQQQSNELMEKISANFKELGI